MRFCYAHRRVCTSGFRYLAMKEGKKYEVYRGLQRPLVLYGLKGKYIYIGAGSIALGIISTLALLASAGIAYALPVLCVITGGGLIYTALGQRKGLHNKTRDKGIYVIETRINRHGTKNKKF